MASLSSEARAGLLLAGACAVSLVIPAAVWRAVPLGVLQGVLVVAVGACWAFTFASRQARTVRLAALMTALTLVFWIPLAGTMPGVPWLLRAGISVSAIAVWMLATANGERLGLFALTPEEDRINAELRRVSRAAGIIGSADDPVRRPADLDALLADLDALQAPDDRWARVVRLTREYLLTLPESDPVPQRDMIEFLMWRRIWFGTHDRRILFAPRPDPTMDFEADVRSDRAEFLRALDGGDTPGAADVLGQLERRTAPAARWSEARDALAAALRSRLAASSGAAADAEAQITAAEARLREVWPAL